MDITKMTVIELKALVYDFIVNVENAQKNIKAINQEIEKRNQEVKPEEEKKEPAE